MKFMKNNTSKSKSFPLILLVFFAWSFFYIGMIKNVGYTNAIFVDQSVVDHSLNTEPSFTNWSLQSLNILSTEVKTTNNQTQLVINIENQGEDQSPELEYQLYYSSDKEETSKQLIDSGPIPYLQGDEKRTLKFPIKDNGFYTVMLKDPTTFDQISSHLVEYSDNSIDSQ
ncbi:hypothetical protein LC087_17305 [Bacillus carboniphilus]|uniref:Uncharacterized protein n=1 Tax=Bacillus carboniphilus TaxID=86663 RepID=A0ABY9JVJ2_9BACI|nr:hypothetical protein [Bacillus carboniphilus]WLR42435.1 hypothetical protein LC087_17305 [Bacillus carboniphilus]